MRVGNFSESIWEKLEKSVGKLKNQERTRNERAKNGERLKN